MPKKRFSDEQIAFALRQVKSGTTIGEICWKMGIAEATFIDGRRIMPEWVFPRSGDLSSLKTRTRN